MTGSLTFLVALIISFFGSIPPGSINVTTMQLAILNHKRAAISLAAGASFVEFGYTAIVLTFHEWITTSPATYFIMQLITASALLLLGIFSFNSHTSSSRFIKQDTIRARNGFYRGILLGLLNPLTVIYWLAVTIYLTSNGWINLQGGNFWLYLAGISVGTFMLLLIVIWLGTKFQKISDNDFLVHKIPGIFYVLLGVYYFIKIWMK